MAHLDAKLLEWSEVQDQIQHILKNSDPAEETSVFLPHGLQPAYSFHHPHVIRCLAFYNSTKGGVFVTHVDAGHRNEMFVWTISNLSQEQVKCVRFSINPSISKLLFVPQHRVFVGFCKDIRLCIFSDVIHNCSELSSITCPTTVLCMAFNELTDELITGGHGSLQAWKMNHVEIRDPLCPAAGFECDLSSTDWVRDVRIDVKTKMIIALCDERVLLISSETRKQIYNFPNWHQTALTSFVFYRKLEYLITSSMDGCIKVWNAVVYGQVHEFVGHFDCVTGLIVHPSDPLLLSSSKDGTVRVWRLDTFELTYRLDYGESILGMRLANHHQLFLYTKHDVKGYHFNQFHHLFTPVQSRVHLLSRIKSSIMPSRILCAAEDGGVRVISPVSGSILTIIYPMATYQVLTDLVYDISRGMIYTVLTTGDVLVFRSVTNPCTPSQLWIPEMQDDSIICITLMKLDCALGKHESSTSESLIFAGSMSGQIHLIEASTVTMPMPVQAHCGTVMNLQISQGDYGKGQNCIEGADRLLSSGSDKTVRIWKLDVDHKFVSLTCMIVVTSSNCACHVSMISNTLCMTMPNFKVLVYDVCDGTVASTDGHQGKAAGRHDEQTYRLYTHHKDNDHTQQITALCSCHRLGIFATTSEDGLVKIWDAQNNLVRELTFDTTLRGVCFANDRGDLLVGFQNHISWVNIVSYLPLTYLENIIDQQFSSDANEEPVTFNHSLQLWFDIDSLLALPMDLVRRKKTLGALEGLRRLSLQAEKEAAEDQKESQSTDSQLNEGLAGVASEAISIQEKIQSSIVSLKHSRQKKLNVQFLPISTECSPETSDDEDIHDEAMQDIALQSGVSSTSVDEASNIAEASVVDGDIEGELETYNWPIAPDGYIPNSIIRKHMRLPDPEPLAESPWKLKPLPFLKSPADSLGKSSKSSDDYLGHAPFTWLSSSTESVEVIDEDEIMSMLSDGVDGDLDVQGLLPLSSDSDSEMSTPDEKMLKRRRKTAAALIKLKKKIPKKTKGRRLTMAMVLEEAMKQKEEEEEKKKSEIVIERKPSVQDILKVIVEMRWFSPKKITINISSVTNALVALLDKVGDSIHNEVCKCIMDIHSELGLNDFLMDKVLNNLLKQIHNNRVQLKCNAVRTMADLGDNRMKVVMGILPLAIDPVPEVKVEAVAALKKLNGLTNREELIKYLASIGVLKSYVNQDKNIVNKVFSQKSPAAFKRFSKYIDRKLPKDLADLQPPAVKVNDWLTASEDMFQQQLEDSEDNNKETQKTIELIPLDEQAMQYEQFNDFQQVSRRPERKNLKGNSKEVTKFPKLPAIKENEVKSNKSFFVPDSCFGAGQAHAKATPTVRRKTMHTEILEAKKYSLYLEKMKMEANMHLHMEIHRRNYEKILKKQRKVRKFLPTHVGFYKHYFGNACKLRRKHEYPKQPNVTMTEIKSDWTISKCATLPRINELEESSSSVNINGQFSVVLDKGSQKHLEVESGIEDTLTCSKLSLSGSQKVQTQYSSGFFSTQELDEFQQDRMPTKATVVLKPQSKLEQPKRLYLTSSVLQSLRKRQLKPLVEPVITAGHSVVYSAAKLPLERAIFPLRMTNKIAFRKDCTLANWDIKRSKGKSTFGVLEMSWSLVQSKEDVSESNKTLHHSRAKQQKDKSLRALH